MIGRLTVTWKYWGSVTLNSSFENAAEGTLDSSVLSEKLRYTGGYKKTVDSRP